MLKKSAFSGIILFAVLQIILIYPTRSEMKEVTRPEGFLTMQDAEREALSNNPLLMSARYGAESAKSRIGEAASGRRARLTLNESVASTTNPTYSFMDILNQEQFTPAMMADINDPGVTTDYNTRLTLTIPIYTGGAAEFGIEAARRGAAAKKYELDRTVQYIRFETRKAYLGVIISEEKKQIAAAALNLAEEHKAIAESLYRNGMTVESDVLSAGVRVSELEEMKLTAENDLELARSGLLLVMGAGQDRVFSVDSRVLEKEVVAYNLEELIKKARSERTDLKAIGAAETAAAAAVEMEKAGLKPSVGLAAQADINNSALFDNDGESWFAGVTVSYSLYDGGRVRSRVSAADAERQRFVWERERLRQSIELEVRQAYHSVETASKKIDAAQAAVAQSEASLAIISNRYKNELAISVEVLKAQLDLTQAKMRKLAALYEYALGVEKLKLAAGLD